MVQSKFRVIHNGGVNWPIAQVMDAERMAEEDLPLRRHLANILASIGEEVKAIVKYRRFLEKDAEAIDNTSGQRVSDLLPGVEASLVKRLDGFDDLCADNNIDWFIFPQTVNLDRETGKAELSRGARVILDVLMKEGSGFWPIFHMNTDDKLRCYQPVVAGAVDFVRWNELQIQEVDDPTGLVAEMMAIEDALVAGGDVAQAVQDIHRLSGEHGFNRVRFRQIFWNTELSEAMEAEGTFDIDLHFNTPMGDLSTGENETS